MKTRQPVRYITVSDWHVNAEEKLTSSNHAQWVLVEQLPNQIIRLRGAERGTEYFNFDRQTAGSYIYSNKKSGAEFEVIKQTQIDEVVPVVGVKNDEAKSEKLYTLNGRQASENEKGIVITESGKKIKR